MFCLFCCLFSTDHGAFTLKVLQRLNENIDDNNTTLNEFPAEDQTSGLNVKEFPKNTFSTVPREWSTFPCITVHL